MLYILLPVHNRKEVTQKFVGCLKQQTYQDFRLILIDDGSTDGTSQMVVHHIPEAVVLRGDGNLWWAGGLQKGYDYLRASAVMPGDSVLLINDDTEFADDFLQRSILLLQSAPKIMVKAWCIDKYSGQKGDGYIFSDLKKLTFTPVGDSSSANCASTRGLFLRAADFLKIGGFVPHVLPHYLSDYEFTMRAVRTGLNIQCDDSICIVSDSKETGFNVIQYRSFGEFVRQFYSIKCPVNPRYLMAFVRLSSESKLYMWLNIFKILIKSQIKVLLAFFFLFGKRRINVSDFKKNFGGE